MSPDVLEVVLMNRARAHGPMLTVCPVPGCSTITMGGTCVEHDEPVETVFPRGRPYRGEPAPVGIVGQRRVAPPA